MNIRNNLVNYLLDKNYVISIYENNAYFYQFEKLGTFNDKKIVVYINNQKIVVYGSSLVISKITKEELLIKGEIQKIEFAK